MVKTARLKLDAALTMIESIANDFPQLQTEAVRFFATVGELASDKAMSMEKQAVPDEPAIPCTVGQVQRGGNRFWHVGKYAGVHKGDNK